MKLKHIFVFAALASSLLQSCDDGYEYYQGVYVSGTMGNNPVISLTVDDNFPKSVDLVVASSEKVTKSITLEMTVDEKKIESYNRKFQTAYNILPPECYVLTHPTVVIESGNYATTAPVKLNIISTEGMIEGRKYMVPVSISRVSDGYRVIENSRTVYIALDQVIVTSALNLGYGRVYAEFWKGTDKAKRKYDTKNLQAVTFEMRTYIDLMATKGFNSLMGQEENLLIRTNTFDDGSGVLDACGGGMGNIKSPSRFPTQVWTHVAMTLEMSGKVLSLYINGEQVASRAVTRSSETINLCAAYEGSGWDYETSRFYIGFSAGSRALNGKVSEARVWARALTQTEIKNNMCAIDPTSSKDLLAYWKFNDNSPVNQFEDLSGNGFTAYLGTATPNWVTGVRCPEK
jgi:hypothetical protein